MSKTRDKTLEQLKKAVADTEAIYITAYENTDASYASYVAWKTAQTRWAEARQALSNYLKEQHK